MARQTTTEGGHLRRSHQMKYLMFKDPARPHRPRGLKVSYTFRSFSINTLERTDK